MFDSGRRDYREAPPPASQPASTRTTTESVTAPAHQERSSPRPAPRQIQTFARIKVVGVGGAGGNAINRMVAMGVDGIEFVSVNTDAQALLESNANISVRIGDKLTKGLGAGGRPDVGARAAEESADQLSELVRGTDMVFITAGMGGGTGTGASPIIAKIAKGAGALTVGVVTRPFEFEGTRRRRAADDGIQTLRENVDALITIPNERLIQMVDPKTSITDAFKLADDVLRQGIGGISDLITKPGIINLDFADVRSIMQNAGSALMSIGYGSGETRTIDAAKDAISSPLLETSIEGATGVLYNITGSASLTLTETSDAAEIIRAAVDEDAEIIYGTSIDESMGDAVMVTLIATGFSERQSTLDFPAPRRQSRGQQAPRGMQQRERGQPQQYRIAQAEGSSRPMHQNPVLPDDDFEEESSIIRFLRDR